MLIMRPWERLGFSVKKHERKTESKTVKDVSATGGEKDEEGA